MLGDFSSDLPVNSFIEDSRRQNELFSVSH